MTDDQASPTRNLGGSLRLTRAMVLVLVGLFVFREAQHQWDNKIQDKLAENARWLYPFVPKMDRDFDFTIDFYGMKYTGNTATDYEILFVGAAEKPELYFLRDSIQVLEPEGGIYIDVGASMGHHSLFMAKHAARVIAFEPFPPAIKKFRQRMELNELKNVELVTVGLGAENSRIPFYAPADGRTNNGSFETDFMKDNEVFGELEIRVGDDELSKLDVADVHILKVDVEGFEPQVLRGLSKTLATYRPVVLMELLQEPEVAKRPFRSLEELQSHFPEDYVFLQFDEYEVYQGHYKLSPLDFDAHVNHAGAPFEITPGNIVACPRENLPRIPMSNATL